MSEIRKGDISGMTNSQKNVDFNFCRPSMQVQQTVYICVTTAWKFFRRATFRGESVQNQKKRCTIEEVTHICDLDLLG